MYCQTRKYTYTFQENPVPPWFASILSNWHEKFISASDIFRPFSPRVNFFFMFLKKIKTFLFLWALLPFQCCWHHRLWDTCLHLYVRHRLSNLDLLFDRNVTCSFDLKNATMFDGQDNKINETEKLKKLFAELFLILN